MHNIKSFVWVMPRNVGSVCETFCTCRLQSNIAHYNINIVPFPPPPMYSWTRLSIQVHDTMFWRFCLPPLLHTTLNPFWRVDPLLRGDSTNNSRYYGAPIAYTCTVTSHKNRRGDAGIVFCRSTPRLHDSTMFCWMCECSAVEDSPVKC
jgi:hypothetical protein